MRRPIGVLLHLDRLGLGGLEKKVTQLALRLDRERFAPTVSYSAEWGVYGEDLERAGIPVIRIVPEPARNRGIGKATGQIRRISPGIFHSFSCSECSDDVFVAHRAGVRAILTGRDNVRHWTSGPAKTWECVRNTMTDIVTPCCEAAAKLCRDVEGIRAEKIVVIHNGVDVPVPTTGPSIREELGLPAGTVLAGYAARYEYLKGHDNLVSALHRAGELFPQLHFVCCGDYDDVRMQQIRQAVADHALERYVTLLGPRNDMSSFYQGLDLYVHPSRSEAFSMAILEAMSYGLPVAAFAVGGTPEAVLDGKTGILAPPGDDRALRHAINCLTQHPELRKEMGEGGRQRIEQCFSLHRMVTAYEDLYMRATEGFGLRSKAPATPRFTGEPDGPFVEDTTVFVTTVGDETNFRDCMEHLKAQTVRCRMEIIKRVAPLSAAYGRMHKLCATPWYVQVDDDMILAPDAIEKLRRMLEQSPPEVALICAPLWDCDMERPVPGIKIYRHAIVKRFPFENTLDCAVRQLEQLHAAGYRTELLRAEDKAACLGEHGRHYTPETIFLRWQRSFHQHNRLGHMPWLDPWPQRLLDRYIETRDPVHLYAMLGAIAGIAGQTDSNRELDWRDIDPALQRMRYYFPTPPKTTS